MSVGDFLLLGLLAAALCFGVLLWGVAAAVVLVMLAVMLLIGFLALISWIGGAIARKWQKRKAEDSNPNV